MRRLSLILALFLAGCGGAPPAPSGLEALLVQLENGDVQVLEPALRAAAKESGNTEARLRLRTALSGLPLSRAQVETVVAPLEPEIARELVSARSLRLAITGDEPPLSQAIARTLARSDDWIIAVPDSDPAAIMVRIHRLPPGDAFALVLHRGREPVRDAVQRCADQPCTESTLTTTILTLLAQ